MASLGQGEPYTSSLATVFIPAVVEGGQDSASGVVAGLPTRQQIHTVFPILFPTMKLRKGSAGWKSSVLWIDYLSGSVTPAGGAAPYQLLLAWQWLWCICHCLWIHLLSFSFWCFQLFNEIGTLLVIHVEFNCWLRWLQKGYTVIWHWNKKLLFTWLQRESGK